MVAPWGEDNQRVGGIGDKLFLEISTLAPLLKRLEAAGLVRRARCAEDERQVRVSLTEQGKALQDEARKHHPTRIERAFSDDPEGAKAPGERRHLQAAAPRQPTQGQLRAGRGTQCCQRLFLFLRRFVTGPLR